MRRLIFIVATTLLSFAAVDALACAKCGTYPSGCDYCYESTYDGADGCELWQGEYCMMTNKGGCQGWLDRWCPGGHCPDDQQAARELESKEWQLVSVEVIRPGSSGQMTRS